MHDNEKSKVILNLDKLRTTDLGIERIKRNLCLDTYDVVSWCRKKIEDPNSSIIRKGKNWYIEAGDCKITVNAYSYTIITAHKINRVQRGKGMEIRELTINDYEEIYELWMSTPGMGLNDIDDSREGIDKYLKRNPNTCFAAVVSGKIAGVILSGHDGRRGYISHTAVSIANRNKGIGSELVDTALKALKDEGIHKVALVVFKHNDIGNTFWERKGFTAREDLNYRNKALADLKRIDT